MKEKIFGIHVINSIIDKFPKHFIKVFVNQDLIYKKRLKNILNKIKKNNITIQLVNNKWLNIQADRKIHQGIIAEIKSFPQLKEIDLKKVVLNTKNHFFLVIDNITDSRNFGACLRNADAAGVHGIIIPKNKSVTLNEFSRKVASGAADNIPIFRVINLVRTLKFLKSNNIWIIGTSSFSKDTSKIKKNFFQSSMDRPIAIVIGSENKGLRRLTSENCDEILTIPMLGKVESLNVSVASGIFLFEAIRQRKIKNVK